MMHHEVNEIAAWYAGATVDLDNMERFMEGIPGLPKEYINRFYDLNCRASCLNLRTKSGVPASTWSDEKWLSGEVDHMTDENIEIYTGIEQLRSDIVHFVDDLKAKKEAALGTWTTGSNLLFLMGWAVGLAGKILGDDSEDEDIQAGDSAC